MKGSVVPAHRRPGSATAAGRGTQGKGGGGGGVGSILEDGALDSTGLRDASPWAPQAAIRSRPASAGVRRTIADDAFTLLGQNKAAAEIQASVRARPASAGLRGRAPGALATATGSRVEDYEPVKKLGQGASGSVHLVVLKEDGSRWVLKQVELGRGGSAPSSERNAAMARAERDNVLREVKLMSSIRSDNIVKYCTSFLHQAPGGMQSVCIVMEYAERGALGDYIKHIRSTARKAEESFIWRCMLQVAAGLAAIHAHRVIHRDVKSANILITAGNDFKIADLGIAVSTSLANVQGRMRTGRCGTLAYMAPEVANDLPYDTRADMWSLGCVLYEVACLRVPFPSGTCVDTSVRVDSGISLSAIREAADALQLPHAYSDLLNNHVLWCMAVEATGRPSARELISTQDSIDKAVQLRVSLPDGFDFHADLSADRVEYQAPSPSARAEGNERGGHRVGPERGVTARIPLQPVTSRKGKNAWGSNELGEVGGLDGDDDLGLSPLVSPIHGLSPHQDRAVEKRAISVSGKPPRARPASAQVASRGAGREAGLASTSAASACHAMPGRLRPASATARGHGARGKCQAAVAGVDRWGSEELDLGLGRRERGADVESKAKNPQQDQEEEETDLPVNLRSKEQADWERQHEHLLRALPGWQRPVAADTDLGGVAAAAAAAAAASARQATTQGFGVNGKISGADGKDGARGGDSTACATRSRKTKRMSKAEKLVAAGSVRRMVAAVRAVLAPTLDVGGCDGMPLGRVERLLEAQVGMKLDRMLSCAGPKGRACSLTDFLLAHPDDFRVRTADNLEGPPAIEVSLQGARGGEEGRRGGVSATSAHILSSMRPISAQNC